MNFVQILNILVSKLVIFSFKFEYSVFKNKISLYLTIYTILAFSAYLACLTEQTIFNDGYHKQREFFGGSQEFLYLAQYK